MKKRNITEFQILSEIVRKQPHIKQKEIAEVLGITVQGVSEHVRSLAKNGFIKSRGRGEYVITDMGMEHLKLWIGDFKDYLSEVNQNLYRYKDTWPAIANEDVKKGDKVYLYMHKGLMYISKTNVTEASAIVYEDGKKGDDISIHELDGYVDVRKGKVIVLKVPPKVKGGTSAVNTEFVLKILEENPDAVIAMMGTVSAVLLNKLDIKPDIRFGVSSGITNACKRGCDVIAFVTGKMTENVLNEIDKNKISYTILDAELEFND
ncbi:winged helix-turn-helix transcriptional regulator [Methanococcus voltae]|uniref:Transcriptional regulator n=2 Tax=Methanococcus voltae TaxID=2188 RepID=A0ABT2EVB1_METVO|nr:winged helix-turn-helix transcriptional regulator [Methanococcus voltae]MBP2171878.1 putative transcriptional regulator [Methanococcus voltae]MBP2201167.1 putative transcriptional regulator [Methanococcus voltae]MCS3921890.1 putative transcriptional regulator [Methanococcus voltae PS]